LSSSEEHATSLTSTLFFAYKPKANTVLVFNPEMAGGSGLSSTNGIAGFTNGETFRVGNVAPSIYCARLFVRHYFPIGKERTWNGNGVNAVAGSLPTKFIAITAGKYCLADYFDNNSYSHDPRTQFMNWALMSNGAWDYPANTRGYTYSTQLEYQGNTFATRFAASLEPTWANGPVLNWNVHQAIAYTLELEKHFQSNMPITIRAIGFYNRAPMASYNIATYAGDSVPDITLHRFKTTHKFGWALNGEMTINKHLGVFARASWNDGHYETWAFTEIDGSQSIGISGDASFIKRPEDNWGIAVLEDELSKDHADYFAHGGSGFMLGDGKLNYRPEEIGEIYYSFHMKDYFVLSPDFQYVINPGYNHDRGPAHVMGLRGHLTI
jgi:high affinity Mn2+ porin